VVVFFAFIAFFIGDFFIGFLVVLAFFGDLGFFIMGFFAVFLVVGFFGDFIFFGFADEARNHYRLAIYSIGKTLGISSFSSAGTSSGGVLTSEVVFKSKSGSSGRIRPGIPVNVHKELFNSRSSIVSVDATFKDVGGLLSEKKGR